MADIDIGTVGRVGRVTLTRPKALNALNHEMALALEDALDRWCAQGEVDMVLVDAEGERAFSAGGDIATLYRSGSAGDVSAGRRFWQDEYRLNVKISELALPYVAIMDGIVMGGGIGISAHGSHRIVTERSQLALPECKIGLVPDVGCSLLLARVPGELGMFLALTGWRMDAGDAVAAGFADVAVSSGDLAALKTALEESGDPAEIARFARAPEAGALASYRDVIDAHFSKDTALACLLSLEADDSELARKAASMIRHASPLSVAVTFAMVRRARAFSGVADAVRQEYRFTFRSMTEGDFLEGVRAEIIDKDRQPKWSHARLEDIDPAMVDDMLAPLGPDELTFER